MPPHPTTAPSAIQDLEGSSGRQGREGCADARSGGQAGEQGSESQGLPRQFCHTSSHLLDRRA